MLRDRADGDEPFLARCFDNARGAAFAGLPEPLRGDILVQQRRAFEHSVTGTPGMLDRVVVQAGAPVGRVIESRVGGDWWLVDIALVDEARGHGVGSAVLEDILAEAREAGASVRLHVGLGERAVAWYVRHGFVEVGCDELHVELRAV
ncbi:MAG: GNAT family N-acetyltransferase [Sandaracinaceae bacterium]|nr:GNAT family N-acetyltransferase [Sandaracinaceae bacterium]MBK7152644.1 GNAT family N-acetyltransferase [Sandaracinaceae bacterium]MBK7773870.1 GNAT family N-acetyltransferase [Sandaracinaceae bacterium]MBK8412895.1 GNAT family N-acetyltransferase [Sandaracinaceae bacterium]MBK8588108.1 GNAT family N-acetyltransferase [Sandaracinaceae bacterium]